VGGVHIFIKFIKHAPLRNSSNHTAHARVGVGGCACTRVSLCLQVPSRSLLPLLLLHACFVPRHACRPAQCQTRKLGHRTPTRWQQQHTCVLSSS
jgi:hypothetical protein